MKAQLESLVEQMHRGGIFYDEAVRVFRTVFITTVLRENRWNRCHAAKQLHMHRNTLRRLIAEFRIDVPRSRYGPQRTRAGSMPHEIRKRA